jgi:YidC/Oxa1 family membrane protein insertase
MSFIGEPIIVGAGQFGSYEAIFYVGPKDQEELSRLAEYLDLTVDYGFLWMIGKPIFFAMKAIHGVIGNWGWSIILLTLLIKLLLFPLSAASLKSMAKMRNLQPEMARLKELYGDDRQKMSQETMSLYKKEKVNPAGGCFPMLLQMPVFLSLYWVLLESVEIRHAPWVFWIQDLSAKDPYFILPLVMGASMLLMQKMQPMPTDPMQAKIMQFMPIGFTFLFMTFPSGLVLYWTVNNLLSMAQQWYVNRQLISKKK